MSEKLESCLTEEKVYVKFYKRRKGNSTIDNPKHVAHGGMLETATKTYVPPRLRSGQYKNILTDDEKKFLEQKLFLPEGELSVYNRDYWKGKKVVLTKENNIFDLSDPDAYINYKILLANTNLIAPSIDVISHKETYVFYMEREGEKESRKVKTISMKQEAYKLFGKYEDDKDILRFILKESKKPTAKNTKIENLQAWTADVIDDNPSLFVKVASDKLIKTKVLLEKAVDTGVVMLRANEYFDAASNKSLSDSGEDATLDNAAIYLNKPRQQELKLSIEARVKNTK